MFEQSGANPSAHFHHDFNDVHGNQNNLKVVVHGNAVLNPEQPHQQKAVENTLEDTIQIIQKIASSVHIDGANMILRDIATILSLLQERAINKDCLNTPARSCRAICITLALATKGASMGRTNGSYGNALGALQSSINGLKSSIRNRLECGLMETLLGPDLSVGEIDAWTTESDRILTSFSTRLNLIPLIPLEQVYEILHQPDMPNLIPEPPPSAPTIYGREELIRDVKDALLQGENVALIGPGGIGKSTLATAVMNEEDIMERYKRRFFVTYAGMNPKTITFGSFVDRIANILGLPMSGADGNRQIETNLGLSRVLLVLDNAETFEDAADQIEAARISDFIAQIISTCNTRVLLTSRTSANAREVSWVVRDVPPLEKEPSRQYFRKIYPKEISDDEVDELLTAVDFHPLTISILAHTAKENKWSAQVLLDRWNSRRSELLQSGHGKSNLEFTIKLSLESPSVEKLGDDAVGVLWIVAFFPQGINQDHLIRLFPSLPGILSVVDTLCKVSLIYPSDSFLTMLAPIRLYLPDAFPNAGRKLLDNVRHVYYSSLRAITEKKNSHANLLISDHLNIEYLIGFDLTHPPFDISAISSACRGFLWGLRHHKARPTLLAPIITSLSEETGVERESKAFCLNALGELYLELSNYSFASTASETAQKLFVDVGNYTKAARCVSTTALSYTTRGNFSRARELLVRFIHSPSSGWQYVDKEMKDKIYYSLDVSRMHLSSNGVDELFLRTMDSSSRGLQSSVRHWQARMHHGHTTPEEVQERIEPLRSDCTSSPDMWNRWRFLETAAEAAFLQRSFDEAVALLDQAYKSVNGSFRLSVNILICKAAVASDQGRFNLSRSLSQRCVDTLGVVATASSTDFLHVLYVQGRNELYAGHYSEARRFLSNVIDQCGVCDETRTKAFAMRALGEAEILLGRKTGSNKYFAQTMAVCRAAGTPPELLGVCNPMLKLDDDKFPGWKKFLATHTGSLPPVGDKSILHSFQGALINVLEMASSTMDSHMYGSLPITYPS